MLLAPLVVKGYCEFCRTSTAGTYTSFRLGQAGENAQVALGFDLNLQMDVIY